MTPRLRLLLAPLGALGLTLSFQWWGASNEEEIRAQLQRVAQSSMEPPEAAAGPLRELLAAELALTINNESQPHLPAEEALALWFGYAAAHAPLYVELADVRVEVAGDRARARGDARVSQSQYGDLHARLVPFDTYLRQRDGRWYVSAVRVEEGGPLLPEARP